MGATLLQKILVSRFAGGASVAPGEAMVKVDQVFVGDGAGSLVMLALEELGVTRVAHAVAACYVDDGTPSEDGRVADDLAYLFAACRRFGLRYSPAGRGVGPWLHLERFAKPGAVIVAAHEWAGVLGAAGCLALPAAALDVALVLSGEAYALELPRTFRVTLTGALGAWTSPVDAALELLRRYGLRGRAGHVLEVTGPGLATWSVDERASFAAMVSELGVVATLFPADDVLAAYLATAGRGADYAPLFADDDAVYDGESELDLSQIEPMIARPQSAANVVPVRFAEGTSLAQVVVGAPGLAGERDLARVVAVVRGRDVAPGVSFELNPTTRRALAGLAETGALSTLLEAGVRVGEPTLAGGAGIGQAPPPGKPSLRTTTKNSPGGSGTRDDRVFLCSPATAAVSAVRGTITRPSEGGTDPAFHDDALRAAALSAIPATGEHRRASDFVEPISLPPPGEGSTPPPSRGGRSSSPPPAPPIAKGASVKPLPPFDALPRGGEFRVMLKLPDDVLSADIVPEGARGRAFGSNVAALADVAFERIDATYVKRAKVQKDLGGHVIVAGHNFGYGATRDHAALALRFLGLRFVIAKSYGSTFRRMLVNAGVVCLTFADAGDYFPIEPGELLVLSDLRATLATSHDVTVRRKANATFLTTSAASQRQVAILLAGGIPPYAAATRGR